MTQEEADPLASAVLLEYVLMQETSMVPEDLDALPYDEAALLLAFAERTLADRARAARGVPR